jgi:hypothetical protein
MLLRCLFAAMTLALAGCATLAEEDPNTQQTPWASPATWEGQIPGMPNQR